MARQAGFDNVVASLGTALPPGQVALLARYAKRIAHAYDVDPAGQSAGTFGVTELNALIGEVQGIAPFPMGVVATGMWSCSANAFRASEARPRITPLPAKIIGRRAFTLDPDIGRQRFGHAAKHKRMIDEMWSTDQKDT